MRDWSIRRSLPRAPRRGSRHVAELPASLVAPANDARMPLAKDRRASAISWIAKRAKGAAATTISHRS